jgi:hypothetical protein
MCIQFACKFIVAKTFVKLFKEPNQNLIQLLFTTMVPTIQWQLLNTPQ